MTNLCAACGHLTRDHDSLFECNALVESLFGAVVCDCPIFVKDDSDD